MVTSLAISPRQDIRAAALSGGASNQARTYTVKALLPKGSRLALRPGMTCRAEIFTRTGNKSVALPIQAVLAEDEIGEGAEETGAKAAAQSDRHYVFVVQEGIARRRTVTIGFSDDRFQQVLSGVKANEQVVTGPYRELKYMKDGDRVRQRSKARS